MVYLIFLIPLLIAVYTDTKTMTTPFRQTIFSDP